MVVFLLVPVANTRGAVLSIRGCVGLASPARHRTSDVKTRPEGRNSSRSAGIPSCSASGDAADDGDRDVVLVCLAAAEGAGLGRQRVGELLRAPRREPAHGGLDARVAELL